jgi:hypothetical protein
VLWDRKAHFSIPQENIEFHRPIDIVGFDNRKDHLSTRVSRHKLERLLPGQT